VSIKLELDANSIKQAISNHIAAQGFNLEGKKVDVALVNGRGGNGNRATITISDSDNKPQPGKGVLRKASDNTASETVAKVIAEVPSAVVEEEILEEVIISDLDPIVAAAEGALNLDAPESDVMQDIFPKTNPSDVKAPESLF